MRFQNEEIAAFIIIVLALLAVGALFLLSGASKPYSWSSADGDRVSVSGTLVSVQKTYQGGHLVLTVRTDAGPLDLFVSNSSDAFAISDKMQPGAGIEATGLVKTYKGKKEVVVEKLKEN
jgi:DNA/RNA endonuclease YhcR with UshA esterase domain